MPRSSAVARSSVVPDWAKPKPKNASPPKKSSSGRRSTPKSTPSKRKLVRDLHAMANSVHQRLLAVKRSCEELEGLRAKVDDVCHQMEEAKKDHDERVGKVEKDILNYQLRVVQEALGKRRQVAIDKFDLKALKELEEGKRTGIKEAKAKQEKKVQEQVAERVRFKEMEFEKQYAAYVATDAANDAERRNLQATIAGLRLEIESQKSLSSELAEANRQIKINNLRRKAIEEQQRKDEAYRAQMQQPLKGSKK